MFGSSLPVCAVRFPTITELVHHGNNGMIFNSASDLTEQILLLLFPNILTHVREKRSMSSSNIDETTDNTEQDQFIRSDSLRSTETVSTDAQDKDVKAQVISADVNNQNIISLVALKRGAADIGSWDDNWKSVLSPLVKSWIR